MSGAIGTAIVGGLASAVIGSMLAPSPQRQPAVPAVVPPPAPQAGKLPDQAAVRAGGAAGGAIPVGAADTSTSTLLTGPGGVDTSSLKLGKNTALGS